jgi:cobalt transporter subunit CbtB
MSNQAQVLAPGLSDRAVAITLAGMLGFALIFLSGFAGPNLIHNAAHDFRHTNNTPCH